MEYLLATAGLALLFVGGEALVRGAVSASQRLGVPSLLIGMVVVGFGTSVPELVVSLDAAFQGNPEIALGNVVGSNIANVLLILGTAALIQPIRATPALLRRDTLAMLATSFLLAGLAVYGSISSWTGATMVFVLCVFIVYSYWSEKTRPEAWAGHLHEQEAEELSDVPLSALLATLALLGGILVIVFGANLLVDNAIIIARSIGISEAVIGLTLVAFGTSLPELATAIMASFRGHSDVAIGNVLGSNLFNIMAVLGVTATVIPLPLNHELGNDIVVMVVVALLTVPFFLFGRRMGRWAGLAFLLLYGIYIASLFDLLPLV